MDIVLTHKNTDFDGLAAMVAATLLYPDTQPVLSRQINPNVKAFLSLHKDLFQFISPKEVDPDRVRRLIVVDTDRWERLDGGKALRQRDGLEILLWDHHLNSRNIEAQSICQEPVGATVTLMVRELKKQSVSLSPIQATLLLAGLYEDTGNLGFSSTTAEDAFAAGYLLEHDADLDIIASLLRPAYGERQKEILFGMLEAAPRLTINGHNISIAVQTVRDHVENLAVVVRMYMDILNVEAAFGIFHHPEKQRCMVIGRSRVEGLDVGEIMRRLGGGGHHRAGSVQLKKVDPQQVRASLMDVIRHSQQASVRIGDLMSFPVVSVAADDTMGEAAGKLREQGCTGMPVVTGETLVGMISRRDFIKLRGQKDLERPVKAYMRTPVHTIDPTTSPMQAVRFMIKHDIGRLPVMEGDRMIGIVTRSDAMTYFYDLMPD